MDKIKLGNNETFNKKKEKDKNNKFIISNNVDQIKSLNIDKNGVNYFINGFNKK